MSFLLTISKKLPLFITKCERWTVQLNPHRRRRQQKHAPNTFHIYLWPRIYWHHAVSQSCSNGKFPPLSAGQLLHAENRTPHPTMAQSNYRQPPFLVIYLAHALIGSRITRTMITHLLRPRINFIIADFMDVSAEGNPSGRKVRERSRGHWKVCSICLLFFNWWNEIDWMFVTGRLNGSHLFVFFGLTLQLWA